MLDILKYIMLYRYSSVKSTAANIFTMYLYGFQRFTWGESNTCRSVGTDIHKFLT